MKPFLNLVILAAIFLCSKAQAVCTSPSGVAGQFQYISLDYKYCDGSAWQSMTISNTAVSCSTAGVLTKNGTDMQFCNGTHWISVNGATAASCVGTTAGTLTWKSANTRMEWCDGANWKIVGNPTPADPCNGKTIGQSCDGTNAQWAGSFDSGRYMIMPPGCTNSISDPTCSGTDIVTKTWNNGVDSYYNIPTVANVASSTTPSSSAQRGHYTTPIIAAITLASQGGVHAAAKYCNDMVSGGFSDWYLPSKSELSYIYCKSTPSSPNTSWPDENVYCGGAGPSNELTGFASANYWSSTEVDAFSAWAMRLDLGFQSMGGKRDPAYVRCVRRY